MKTGLLGGTFDPIHNAHLSVAEEARARLNLTKILFVPAGQPWLKGDTPVSAAEHRAEMVRLAIADKPYFKLSTMEIERAGPSYTIDTIAELRAGPSASDELYLILGSGSLAELPKWRAPARLITMCRIVVAPRPGYPQPNLDTLEAIIPGISRRVTVMDKPEMDVSASDIRKRVAQGLSISHLVPESVHRYIKQNKLYLNIK